MSHIVGLDYVKPVRTILRCRSQDHREGQAGEPVLPEHCRRRGGAALAAVP